MNMRFCRRVRFIQKLDFENVFIFACGSTDASTALLIVLSALFTACGTPGNFLTSKVSSSPNPLVALYTVGSGCAGQVMVEFGTDTTYDRSTSWYPVNRSRPLTIDVAGMLASTTYHMRAQRQCGGVTDVTPDATFTTGALPSTPFPHLQVSRPQATDATPESAGVELVDTLAASSNQMQAFITDRDANPIWYYDVGNINSPETFKQLPNTHMIFSIVNSITADSLLREIDLAGNTIREMDINTLKQKTANVGYDFVPAAFHHDLVPLANGHLIVLVYSIQDFDNLPGYPGTTAVQGDQLIDLDENWNPVWEWNTFDHLDVNRHLNGLPDWTHSNAIVYLPDGNLLLSMRHQSWILKIDYNNGHGSGDVLWHLGYEGDFALTQGDDPSLWFSFQHFPSLISQNGSQMTLAVWDNGDNRPLDASGTICGVSGAPACYSQAMILQLDESAMVADRAWNNALGYFGIWGGSINQLPNGNVEFDLNSPLVAPVPGVASEVQEVTQTVPAQVVWKMDIPFPMYAYRAYRIPSLYPGVTWQY